MKRKLCLPPKAYHLWPIWAMGGFTSTCGLAIHTESRAPTPRGPARHILAWQNGLLDIMGLGLDSKPESMWIAIRVQRHSMQGARGIPGTRALMQPKLPTQNNIATMAFWNEQHDGGGLCVVHRGNNAMHTIQMQLGSKQVRTRG